MRKLFIWGLMLGALTACEREVPERYRPDGTSKLVVTAFISPADTTLAVRVTRSTPILGVRSFSEDDQVVTDATVSITGPDGRVELTYAPDTSGVYRAEADGFVQSGQTYALEVTTPDGERTTASCTVPRPKPIPAFTYELDTVTESFGFGGSSTFWQLDVVWDDAPGPGDFYRVGGRLSFERTAYVYLEGQIIDSVAVEETYPTSFYPSTASDETGDGRRYALRDNYLWQISPFERNHRLTLFLLLTDEPYFRYHRSLNNYTGGDPFSEPAPLYSNVTGGLGVFASYTTGDTLEVPL